MLKHNYSVLLFLPLFEPSKTLFAHLSSAKTLIAVEDGKTGYVSKHTSNAYFEDTYKERCAELPLPSTAELPITLMYRLNPASLPGLQDITEVVIHITLRAEGPNGDVNWPPRWHPVTQEEAGFNLFVTQACTTFWVFQLVTYPWNICIAEDILVDRNTTQDALGGTESNVYSFASMFRPPGLQSVLYLQRS